MSVNPENFLAFVFPRSYFCGSLDMLLLVFGGWSDQDGPMKIDLLPSGYYGN